MDQTETRETLNKHETPPASCLTHLLHGGEVPHSDGVVLGHCCYQLPPPLHRESQHRVLVRAHQGVVVPGLDIQVAQIPSSCRGQDFVAVWADADRTHWSLMLWGKTQESTNPLGKEQLEYSYRSTFRKAKPTGMSSPRPGD